MRQCITRIALGTALFASWPQGAPAAPTDTLPSAGGEKEKWKGFLQDCARYEWVRIRNLSFDSSQEEAQFRKTKIEVDLGDGVTVTLVKIPAGEYTEGLSQAQVDAMIAVPNRRSDSETWRDMLPVNVKRRVEVPYDFFVMETLATNAMFRRFVEETGYRTSVSRYRTGWIVEPVAKWKQGIGNDWNEPPLGWARPDHPVVQVSWFDTMAFANWLSAKCGVVLRPPTKDEWLMAAYPPSLSGQQASFTWGNEIGAAVKHANFGTSELKEYDWIHEQYSDGFALTSPVKAYSSNERKVYDMAGNIWSWNFQRQVMTGGKRAGDDGAGAGDSRRATVPDIASLGAQDNGHITMQGGCYLARIPHISLFAKMSHPALDGAEDIGIRLVAVQAANSGLTGQAR